MRRSRPGVRGMKSFTEFNKKRVGLLSVAVILALGAGALLLNRSIFQSSYTVQARFSSAAGIGDGDAVVLAGVNVGSVSGLHIRGNSVVADLAINGGTVLPAHTSASIQVETLLGVLQVALIPGSGWAHPLHQGALITDTSVPVELYQLQDAAGTLVSQSDAKSLNQLIGQLSDLTKGKQQEVSQIISGLDRITAVVDQRSGQVSSLLDAANTLSSAVASGDHQLASLVDNLDIVMKGLAAESSTVRSLILNTEAMATQVAAAAANNEPQLQQLLDHLHSVLSVVSAHQLDLAEALSYMAAGIHGFADIGESGSTLLGWANAFENAAGSAGPIVAVFGNCGAIDIAMNAVLGPDPVPCSERSGPLPPSGWAGGGVGSSSGAVAAGSPGVAEASGNSGGPSAASPGQAGGAKGGDLRPGREGAGNAGGLLGVVFGDVLVGAGS